MMSRLHLLEIHDCSWCPSVLRDGLTDFLATSIATFDSYGPIRPRLLQALQESGSTRIVDLCSGGGGPWKTWSRTIANLPPVVLTDKFPNQAAAVEQVGSRVEYCNESVDATAVPSHLKGFRTIFTAAHHFRPEIVRKIIADAVSQRQPIAIFELTHRSLGALLFMSLSGAGVWLLTPKMGRITWQKLLLTYPLPIIPLMTSVDGMVSCLRTYTPQELSSMASDPSYNWEIGTEPAKPVPVTYLIGIPK